ncbi:hypothetical protein NL676_035077 [Syzygium grande]|nr:hypothetical protein NL676_035077 [Syzygium grande]
MFATFFSQVMAAIGGNTAGPGDAVVNVYINHEKKFAFVEMRSVEEASNAMALDGIIFEGAPVKVRRFSDYNPSFAATLGPSQPNPNLNLGAVGLTPGSAGGLEGPDLASKLMYQLGALATKVVCLTQVVTEDELKDDGEYEDILEDMRQEGGKFGNLVNVAIPRPLHQMENLPQVLER